MEILGLSYHLACRHFDLSRPDLPHWNLFISTSRSYLASHVLIFDMLRSGEMDFQIFTSFGQGIKTSGFWPDCLSSLTLMAPSIDIFQSGSALNGNNTPTIRKPHHQAETRQELRPKTSPTLLKTFIESHHRLSNLRYILYGIS